MARRIGVIIPARFASSRFPGKPVRAVVAGRSLLQRVIAIARAVDGLAGIYVATDNDEIADHARKAGAKVVMTPADAATGTDRVAAALSQIPPLDAVINLQGDALLTPPWVVAAIRDELEKLPSGIVTPAVHLSGANLDAFIASKDTTPDSGTTVVTRADGYALYFSKSVLPHYRKPADRTARGVLRHVGLYGYTTDALAQLVGLPPSGLEKAEGLEQLRALEAGIPVKVVLVDYRGRSHWSIDAPEDVARAEAIIAREGELVP